jgi:hypothetical protein
VANQNRISADGSNRITAAGDNRVTPEPIAVLVAQTGRLNTVRSGVNGRTRNADIGARRIDVDDGGRRTN